MDAYRTVRTEKYPYDSYANGEKELYDLQRDPHELRSFYPWEGDALKYRLWGLLSSPARCVGDDALSRSTTNASGELCSPIC